MATVTWIAAGQITPQVDTLTVGSHTAGHTFVCTFGNGKTVTYVATAADTTDALVTTNLLAALNAETNDPEVTEFTFAAGATATTITATGPDDGTPCTLSVSGTGTFTIAHTAAASSPNDLANAANYSGGALPSNNDTLVFENNAADVKWNLTALTAITLTVIRRVSYTGRIGLDDVNPAGYHEYRAVRMDVKSASITCEQSAGDGPLQFRLNNITTGGATTVVVRGDASGASPGDEVLEVTGLPASSVVNVTGGSVAVSPLAGQTATVATLRCEDGTLTLGSGVTLTTASLKNTQARLDCGYTTLNVYGGGQVTLTGSGGGTNTNVYNGTLLWRSTGSPGTPVVGPQGVLDFSQTPSTVTLGGTVELNAGGRLLDPAFRLASGYAVKFNRCNPRDADWDCGPDRTATIT
jgi:hypothetical protein